MAKGEKAYECFLGSFMPTLIHINASGETDHHS